MIEPSRVRRFKRLLLTERVEGFDFAREARSAFESLGRPVAVVPDDRAAVESPGARQGGTLLLLSRPEVGWVEKAELGCLYIRPREYYLHPIMGCTFACTYCYLLARPQGRLPLRLHLEQDEMFREIAAVTREAGPPELLFSTGELADSLAEIDLFPVAADLVEFFATLPGARLELRTKSDMCAPLLGLRHRRKTVVAFSLAPEPHIQKYEPGTARLDERLRAAAECQGAGYRVAFKFEPVMIEPGIEQLYTGLLDQLRARVDLQQIDHVSVGALRWSERLKDVPTFARHHGDQIADSDVVEYRPGRRNGTPRLASRRRFYAWFTDTLSKADCRAPVYLSVEQPELVAELSPALTT